MPTAALSPAPESLRFVRAGPAPATLLLIALQLVVWAVVRRELLPGNAWVGLALSGGPTSWPGLLVAQFVHLDPVHLGVNLLVLWFFGSNLEFTIGSIRFALLYLTAGWFASLMQWAAVIAFQLTLLQGDAAAAVGSSGAVAGVLGAALVRFPQARLQLPLGRRATFPVAPFLTLWFTFSLLRAVQTTLLGISEGVGHWAHLAGFLFGLAAAQLGRLHLDARAEHLRSAAVRARERGEWMEAAASWSALLAMRPDDLEARTALIELRLAMGDLPGARRLARVAIEAEVRAGRRDAALSAYRRFASHVPALDLPPGVRYRVGCWLADVGDEEESFRALMESVHEEPDTPAAAAALYRAGVIALEALASPGRARQAWEALLERFPEAAWATQAREGLARLGAGSGAATPAAGNAGRPSQ